MTLYDQLMREVAALRVPSLPLVQDAARVARVDAPPRDPELELEALKRRFDQAPDMLENYTLADPWLYGTEAAARAAAERAAMGGASAHADEDLAGRFDRAPQILENYALADPWLHGEQAAAAAAARHDYDPSPAPRTALETSAARERETPEAHLAELRAKSNLDPLSAFIPLDELTRMTEEERAAMVAVVAANIAELRAKSNGRAP